MNIHLAVFVAAIAAAGFAQSLPSPHDGDSATKAAARTELQSRARAELARLKAEAPGRYVENADFSVDPQSYADKHVAVFGFGGFASAENGVFTFRIGDSFGGTPAILVDFSNASKETKRSVLKADMPPHLWTVEGTWKYGEGGGKLVAAAIRDLGEARYCSSLSDCLKSPEDSSQTAELRRRASVRSRVSAELKKLKAESPRRYVENVDFNVDPQAYADKRVVAVGFGNFSANDNGVFTVRIADSYGGTPAITADFSKLSKETKKTLLETNSLPHLLLVAGVWRKTPAGWRLFADEARDLGETRFCGVLAECVKAPEPGN